MKTAFFFGSFNPVHNAHISLSLYVLSLGIVDRIVWVVSPQNPHKDAHSLIDIKERIHLCRLALKNQPLYPEKISISDIETKLGLPSFTYKTIHALRKSEEYGADRFFLLMGEDNFLSFHTWKNYEEIPAECEFIVYPRALVKNPDKNPASIDYFPTDIFLQHAPIFDISSTQIRSSFLKKDIDSARRLAPPEVIEYIIEKNLLPTDEKDR